MEDVARAPSVPSSPLRCHSPARSRSAYCGSRRTAASASAQRELGGGDRGAPPTRTRSRAPRRPRGRRAACRGPSARDPQARRAGEQGGVDGRPLADEHERLRVGEVVVCRRPGQDGDVVPVEERERVERPDDVLVVVRDEDPHQRAAAMRAASARACPTASARPSSGGSSPRTAAAKFATSSWYRCVSGSGRPRPRRRGAARARRGRRRTPATGGASLPSRRPRPRAGAGGRSRSRSGRGRLREAHHAGEADIDPGGADDLLGVHDLRLARHQPRDIDAVGADVEQRAAAEVGVEADVDRPGEVERELRPDEPGSPIAPSTTSSFRRFACGWCRYMNASMSTSPTRSARSKVASTSSGRVENGFSTRTCFPPRARASPTRRAARWAARRRPHPRPGRRGRPRSCRARARSRARARTPPPGRGRGCRPRRPRRRRRAAHRRGSRR